MKSLQRTSWGIQGTTSSRLHLFFAFLPLVYFIYERTNELLRRHLFRSFYYSYLWTVVPIYFYLFLFCEFYFQAPCQTVVNSRKRGTYTVIHAHVRIRWGVAIYVLLWFSGRPFFFLGRDQFRTCDVVIVIYCRRLVVGRVLDCSDGRSFLILYMEPYAKYVTDFWIVNA